MHKSNSRVRRIGTRLRSWRQGYTRTAGKKAKAKVAAKYQSKRLDRLFIALLSKPRQKLSTQCKRYMMRRWLSLQATKAKIEAACLAIGMPLEVAKSRLEPVREYIALSSISQTVRDEADD